MGAQAMGQGIDGAGDVNLRQRRDDEAPGNQLQPRRAQGRHGPLEDEAQRKKRHHQRRRRDDMEAIEEAELGQLRPIADLVGARLEVSFVEDPPHVGEEQTLVDG